MLKVIYCKKHFRKILKNKDILLHSHLIILNKSYNPL